MEYFVIYTYFLNKFTYEVLPIFVNYQFNLTYSFFRKIDHMRIHPCGHKLSYLTIAIASAILAA